MEPVLIATDTSFTDVAAIESFDMDLAYGLDEQDFEISFESPLLTGGELLYIDGTAYGGIVDVVETQSNSTITTYRGRTWHGILSGKIIAPAYNQDYVTVSGEANVCIGQIIQRVGLSGLMSVSGASSGIQITSYQFARFVNAYDGLVSMLAASGAKLVMKRQNGTVELSAAPITVIANEVDSDILAFTQSVNHRVPNHLVCAGEGELSERVRLDLYADAQGNVSETQTYFGVDEIAVFYDYTGADLAQLRADGTKTLKDLQTQGNIEADVEGVGEWDVGDVLTATDNRIGRSVTAQIVKKVVKVSKGNLSTSYEVGLPTGTASTINNSTEGGGGGTVYTAGDGITISSGVISAEVTQAELDAVSGVANAAIQTINGTAPITATKTGTTYTIAAEVATQTSAGLMSAEDKQRLDAGIGDALTRTEAASTYQPIGNYVTESDVTSMTGIVRSWVGTKVQNIGSTAVSTYTLFTKAELQAIVGTNWTPTGSNCAVFVMNGDYGVMNLLMTASINSSSVVRVVMSATRSGNLRTNYMIVRFA